MGRSFCSLTDMPGRVLSISAPHRRTKFLECTKMMRRGWEWRRGWTWPLLIWHECLCCLCYWQFIKLVYIYLFLQETNMLVSCTSKFHHFYIVIFIILFTCYVTVHENHETGYIPLMKSWQTVQFEHQIGFVYVGCSCNRSRIETERVRHRKHFSFFARKNELSTFNDRYLHCDTNRVLGPKHKI